MVDTQLIESLAAADEKTLFEVAHQCLLIIAERPGLHPAYRYSILNTLMRKAWDLQADARVVAYPTVGLSRTPRRVVGADQEPVQNYIQEAWPYRSDPMTIYTSPDIQLTTDITARHHRDHLYVTPQPLPLDGQRIYAVGKWGSVNEEPWIVKAVVEHSVPYIRATHVMILQRDGDGDRAFYHARYHQNGLDSGVGRVEKLSAWAFPPGTFRLWRGSGGLRGAVATYLRERGTR